MRIVRMVGIVLLAFLFGGALSWATTSTIEPAPQLDSIITSCWEKDPSPTYIRCVKGNALKRLVQSAGVTVVMKALNDLFASKKTVAGFATTSCHDVAHIVGELSVEGGRSLGDTIASCGGFCSYGCVHGALLSGIKAHPELANNPDTICTSLPQSAPFAHRVACEHGIGHGMAELASYDMSKAFASCDGLSSEAARFHCGRGVVMEVVDSPVLAHPKRTLPEDILSFCNELSGIYRDACLVNVGSRELARSGRMDLALGNCRRVVPDKLQESCMEYLGQNGYFLFNRDVDKLLTLCGSAEDKLFLACVAGGLEAISYYQRTDDAVLLCNGAGDKLRTWCFLTFGEKLEFIHGKDMRKRVCGNLSGPPKTYCQGT